MRMVYAVMNCERHKLKGGKVQRKTVSTHCVKKKKEEEGCYRGAKCVSFGVANSQPSHSLPMASTPSEEWAE